MSHDQNEPTFQASAAQTAAVSAPAEAPDHQSSSSSFGEQTATAVAAEAPPAAPSPAEQEDIAATPEAGSTSMPQPSGPQPSAQSAAEAAAEAATETMAPSATQPANGEAETAEGMEQLIEQYATPPVTPAEGEIFDGRVIAVNDTGVVVDVGGKFEGLVPAQEFLETGGAIPFGPGQTIEVERLHEH